MMKRLFIYTFLCLYSISLFAEENIAPARPDILRDMSGVEVIQDSAILILLQSVIEGEEAMVEIDGYRVQVYSSNQQQTAKLEALELETRLKTKIDQSIYVVYLPPFWKVRIGDFRSYNDAKEYKKMFVQLFPELMGDTYIVRDKVKVLK